MAEAIDFAPKAIGGSMMRFDFYRASLLDGTDAEQVINHLALQNPTGDLVEGRARMGYEACTTLRDEHGDRWCDVLRGPAGVLVEVSGDTSPAVVGHVRSAWPRHAVSRADVCEDLITEERGLFERLHPELKRVVRRHGRVQAVTISADKSEEGASYRIGSRTSETFVRVYQKPEQLVATRQGHPSLKAYFGRWVRAEVEVKPQKDNRYTASVFEPEQFCGLSRIARDVTKAILDIDVGKTSVIDYKELTTRERSRRACVKQFGKTLAAWKEDLGSWAELGISLRDMIEELEREKARWR